MSNVYLHRKDTPFGDRTWGQIDEVVVEAARSELSARRLLHIEGPYAFGLKAIPTRDEVVAEEADGVRLSADCMTPLVVISKGFTLAARDIAAFEQSGVPMDLGVARSAAIACARQEDALLFNGVKAVKLDGLLSAKGTLSAKLRSWEKVGAAMDNVIEAATRLDQAGFHGPYALALTPGLYNLLFRRYPQGDQTEMRHVQALATAGIVKAPAIGEGGLLLASGRQYASIVLGQDLMTGFVGPADGVYEFTVCESVALRLLRPDAVCILR
jgi:uncharacterized linocin/CFP29 family protein